MISNFKLALSGDWNVAVVPALMLTEQLSHETSHYRG
jgi:hypothetical protein